MSMGVSLPSVSSCLFGSVVGLPLTMSELLCLFLVDASDRIGRLFCWALSVVDCEAR